MAATAPRMRATGLEARSAAAFWDCWGGELPPVAEGEPEEAVGVLEEEAMVELEPEEGVGTPEAEPAAEVVLVVRVEDALLVVAETETDEAELLAEEEGLEVLEALELETAE
jgi:hypothetical protein